MVWSGTNNGTITGADGKFELKPQDSVNEIVTTYVGYVNDTTQVDGKSFVEITMSEGIDLDDVVVKAQRPMVMKAKGAQNIDVIGTAELCRAACCNLGESFSKGNMLSVISTEAKRNGEISCKYVITMFV